MYCLFVYSFIIKVHANPKVSFLFGHVVRGEQRPKQRPRTKDSFVSSPPTKKLSSLSTATPPLAWARRGNVSPREPFAPPTPSAFLKFLILLKHHMRQKKCFCVNVLSLWVREPINGEKKETSWKDKHLADVWQQHIEQPSHCKPTHVRYFLVYS